MSIFPLSPDQRGRGERLKVRLSAWPHGVRPGDSAAFCAAVAPLCLPLMFDRAEKALEFPDGSAIYRLLTWEPVFNTVSLYSESWRWVAGDGSVQGRGLVSLWSWRFDRCCTLSHMDLMGLFSAEAAKPKRRRKSA